MPGSYVPPCADWAESALPLDLRNRARPALQALPDDLREQFVTEYQELLNQAYPMRPSGTVLPFRRIFVVAHRVPPR